MSWSASFQSPNLICRQNSFRCNKEGSQRERTGSRAAKLQHEESVKLSPQVPFSQAAKE